jgi:beta-fructofuranosidase
MLFYCPDNSVAADIIPFCKDGKFHLFYLRDFRDIPGKGEGTPWHHLQTEDFIDFVDYGEAIPRGSASEQDLYVFTGSVFEHDGKYYIFYTGHNPHYQSQGKPCEVILLAESGDLKTWKKNPDFELRAPDFYEPDDWRDPFVFKHPETDKFIMLMAARKKDGASRRRGCIAYAESTDLIHWDVAKEPFFSPARYFTHECPDLFRIGKWWYLAFSEFTDKTVTRYVMGKSCFGPWISPENDCLDNSIFYAAKSSSDGSKRYLFGWNRTKAGNADEGALQWGGNIVVHMLSQNSDGTLAVSIPGSVEKYFSQEAGAPVQAAAGPARAKGGDALSLNAHGGYGLAVICGMEPEMLFEADIRADKTAREFGVMLYCDEKCEDGYYLKFEPAFQRIVMDKWPRNGRNDSSMLETERHVGIETGKWQSLKIVICGTMIETYFDGRYAMSSRAYCRQHNNLGVFCANGAVEFRNVRISTTGR